MATIGNCDCDFGINVDFLEGVGREDSMQVRDADLRKLFASL